MRQHITPADPTARIPEPNGSYLPPGGIDVEMSSYWYAMAYRGDIIVTSPLTSGDTTATPAPVAAVQMSDAIPILRAGTGGSFTVADLVSFLSALGLGAAAPVASGDSQSGALLPFGLL